MKRPVTYKDSGVDIHGNDLFKSRLKGLVKSSHGPEVLKNIGGFGSFFAFDQRRFKKPVLVSSADGVGTKLKVAFLAGKHDTVGIDAVAMNVNDILCVGAQPLFFLDYIAYSRVEKAVLYDVVKGITAGCVQSGCALIGGETAQMPDMYPSGEYDIAGFCVGVVEESRSIDGSAIEPGNVVIGLASSGLHSNGYSLVRKALGSAELKRMSAELLKPTRIYVKPVLDLLARENKGRLRSVRGISNITGGGFYDKIARIIPNNVDVRIFKSRWQVPNIFRLVQLKGCIDDREMFHTLNMGIGMVLVVEAPAAKRICAAMAAAKIPAWAIGEAVKGSGSVSIE